MASVSVEQVPANDTSTAITPEEQKKRFGIHRLAKWAFIGSIAAYAAVGLVDLAVYKTLDHSQRLKHGAEHTPETIAPLLLLTGIVEIDSRRMQSHTEVSPAQPSPLVGEQLIMFQEFQESQAEPLAS